MGRVTFNIPDVREGAKNLFAEIKVDVADLGIFLAQKKLYRTLRHPYATDVGEFPVKSSLNTPVISNLHLGVMDREGIPVEGKNNYIDLEGNTIAFNPIRIDAVLMTVSLQKNIIKTSLQGREGTIKEYIGADDYVINVSGVISLSDHLYPEQAVNDLIKIASIPDQIYVESKFLGMFGISYVVIESPQFSEQRGVYNQQAFEITMISDTAPEFEAGDNDLIV